MGDDHDGVGSEAVLEIFVTICLVNFVSINTSFALGLPQDFASRSKNTNDDNDLTMP